jgi:hypothetical protein
VLRNRRKRSRNVVVYEVCSGAPKVKAASVEEVSDAVNVTLEMGRKRQVRVVTPASADEHSEDSWRVVRS